MFSSAPLIKKFTAHLKMFDVFVKLERFFRMLFSGMLRKILRKFADGQFKAIVWHVIKLLLLR